MPFTPFHFGPGVLVKSALRRHFSFTVFIFTQVTADFETLYYLLKNEMPLHRFLHTYLGANVNVLIALGIGRPFCQWGLKLLGRPVSETALSLRVVLFSAVIGSYSHVFLDSVMHGDVRPFSPFSSENPAYRMISLGQLHAFCLWTGILGLLIAGGMFLYPLRKQPLK